MISTNNISDPESPNGANLTMSPQYEAIKKLLEDKVSKSLLKEIESFVKRNKIVSLIKNPKKVDHCCIRCLNAYTIKKIIDENELDFGLIEKALGKEIIGHNGYYMDGKKLVKI